jgi:two-component system nitrate/nitrite response regulator NarL
MTAGLHPIKVVLVDDHPLFREGLRHVIEGEPQFEVVGEAGDAIEGLQVVESERPDVVVVDLCLGQTHGSALIQNIQRTFPEIRILVLSMVNNFEEIAKVMRAGAIGYLTKMALPPQMLEALTSVAQGQAYFPPELAEHLIDGKPHRPMELATREYEFLSLLVAGFTVAEAASKLNLTNSTARGYIRVLYRKLGVNSQAALVLTAIRQGIVPSPPSDH